VSLEPGSEAYIYAKDVSKVLSTIDPDSNIVIVSTDNFEITTGEVVQTILQAYGQKADELKKMEAGRIKTIVEMNAERLAQQKLVLTAAKNAGITIVDAEIDSLLQLQYRQAGGEEAFLNAITQRGYTIEFVKEDVSNNFIMQQYMEDVIASATSVSEQELNDKYRQMIQKDRTASVQHVLLMTQGKSESEKAEIYKKIKKIHSRAKNGEDFGMLAKNYSEDPGSKDKGGLYENFERGTMVKPFEDAAFSVPIGEISNIIETQYGYHILKVVDRKRESRSFEELKAEIEKDLRNKSERSIVDAHMEELKNNSNYIKISL
jgi:parvulin-like peptidyl-prolyl isomerase